MSDKNITISQSKDNFYTQIKTILQSARDRAYSSNLAISDCQIELGLMVEDDE